MKLVPTVISAVCPVCLGKGSWIHEHGTQSVVNFCDVCSKSGRIYSVVLAPVGYDGKGEVEIKPEILRYGVVRPDLKCSVYTDQGHCGDCKWWKMLNNNNNYGQCLCESENMPTSVELQGRPFMEFPKDFGCIHFEPKE